MSRKFKTSQRKREDFIYYTAEGTRIVISPGEDGATEALIETLHNFDDEEVDEQRRHDYRVTAAHKVAPWIVSVLLFLIYQVVSLSLLFY